MRLLGAAKVSGNNRIALVSPVAKKLKIEVGDHVLFYETDDGQVVVKKG